VGRGDAGVRRALAWLETGDWLTPARIRVYGTTLLVLYGLIFLVAWLTAHGNLDITGKPLGTDFSQVWIAGRLVLAGHPETPFDPRLHAAAQHAVFGQAPTFYGWHYPPYFLAVAALLAHLPYLPALLVWQAVTLAFYAMVMHRILPGRLAMLGALAFPAVFINLGHGHNGFLTASLMGGALLLTERRPLAAGALFALLAYKPQFGLAVPVALLAGGYGRAIAAATITVIALTAASLWEFGAITWFAFFANLGFTRHVVLEQGDTGWEKIQSVFAAVRMWGGGIQAAYEAQAVVSVLALAAVALIWRRCASMRLRAAALPPVALLTTPYCLDYDMMLLAPALAFLVAHAAAHGFRRYEKSCLAVIWLSPLLARLAAQQIGAPVGLAAIAGLLGLICVRAWRGDAASSPHPAALLRSAA
jgi:hypothetical protein